MLRVLMWLVTHRQSQAQRSNLWNIPSSPKSIGQLTSRLRIRSPLRWMSGKMKRKRRWSLPRWRLPRWPTATYRSKPFQSHPSKLCLCRVQHLPLPRKRSQSRRERVRIQLVKAVASTRPPSSQRGTVLPHRARARRNPR